MFEGKTLVIKGNFSIYAKNRRNIFKNRLLYLKLKEK